MRSTRTDLAIGAAFCGAIGLYDVLYVVFSFSGGILIGPPLKVLYADFLVYHAAVRAWLEGKAALIYDIDAFSAFQSAIYADRFPSAAHFRPFFYPPFWLLLLLPSAVVGVNKGYALFMALTVALATALEGRRDWPGWLAVLVSPAAVWTLVAGQNTFLSIGLLYGGLRLLDRAPAASGILLGLLAYKPQLWILVPVALLAAGRWYAIVWMAGTIAALSLASLGAFGLDFWYAFLASARAGSAPHIADEMYRHFYMQMVTLFAAARIAGLPADLANVVQLGGALASVVAVWFVFRRQGPTQSRTAFLVAATFLVSPYTMNYDLLLLMPAVVMSFRVGAVEGFYPGERLMHLILWLMPTLGPILNLLDVPIMPLLILLFAAAAWLRMQAASAVGAMTARSDP